MHIGILSPSIYPFKAGGVQIHVFKVAMILSKIGHKVSVFVTSNKFSKLAINNNFSIYTFPAIRKSFLFFCSYLNNSLLRVFFSHINIDLFHAHVAAEPAFSAILLSKILKIPYILTCHGTEIKVPASKLFAKLQRIALQKATYITCVSKDLCNLVSRFLDNRKQIFLIPSGVDSSLINMNKSVNISSSTPVEILFIGRLYPIKDPMSALKAFRIVTEMGYKVRLTIIGEGPVKSEIITYLIQSNLEGSVIIEGEVPHKRILSYLNKADIFLMTSLSEGTPIILLEAMACGKACIATQVGGIPEYIKHGENGILVPPRNPKKIASEIVHLVRNQSLIRRYGENAMNTISSKYTWESLVKQYLSLYYSIRS